MPSTVSLMEPTILMEDTVLTSLVPTSLVLLRFPSKDFPVLRSMTSLVFLGLISQVLIFQALIFQALIFQALIFQALIFQALIFQALIFQALKFQNLNSQVLFILDFLLAFLLKPFLVGSHH